MKQLFITVLTVIISFCNVSIAQNQNLDKYFTKYHTIEFDFNKHLETLNDRHSFHQLKLNIDGENSFLLQLTPTSIFSEDYVRRDVTEFGEEKHGIPDIFTFKGYVEGYNDSYTRLAISDNFISGTVRIGDDRYVIQNMNDFDEEASPSSIIIYKPENNIIQHPGQCGTHHLHHQVKHSVQNANPVRLDGDCFEVEIALASDWLMFLDHGSANNVEDQIIGVLDDVQGNYDDEFPDEILFEVTELFIVTSESADPWTNSTDAGDVLNSFRSWGNGGGFGGGYDVATLWTDRDFNGGTIGVAWLDALCGSFRYNTCQDYTSSSWGLRVLQAHEFGHNFGSGHDGGGSGFIMAPAVNNTNSWSESSINQIESHYTNVNCLDECEGSGPAAPEANFTFEQEDECSPLVVEFEDLSTGIIDDWFWEFEGGSPSTSTEQNPTVTYNFGGSFDVTLTVSNAGGDDEFELNNVIDVLDGTDAFFIYDNPFGSPEVTFTDQSENDVITWFWDFGDGNISTDENPIHNYEEDGEYTVYLEVYNGECYAEYEVDLEIATPPVANFAISDTLGCAPLVVLFDNLSTSNVDEFVWEFEGGDPEWSNDEFPTVTYTEPGTYDVYLFVANETGEDELLLEDQITILPGPDAFFSNSIFGTTVDFTNQSDEYDEVEWDFGDGNMSDEEDPTHIYEMDGTYTVTLTATGDCGSDVYTETIVISSMAAAVISQDVSTGCLPLSVTFDGSESYLSENFDWTFEGANPSTSNEQIVTVTYDEVGLYNVTLIVENSFSADTLTIENAVQVNDAPTAEMLINNDALNFDFEAIPDGTFNTVYSWDFGDGNNAEGQMVNHVYGQEGIYTVTMTATNECGSSTTTQEYNLYTMPTAGFSASVIEGCVPLEVSFTNESSVNAETVLWTFEGVDPGSSTESNPTVTYTEAGIYSVSLNVSNPAGEDELIEFGYIVVKDVPQTSFDTDHDQTTISFNNLTLNGDSYEWDFGDGNMSNEENPVHIYDDEGEYWVTLIATNECGPSEIALLINVTLRPTASFSVEQSSGCAPFEVQYFDESSSNAEAWTWSFPGGMPESSNEQNPIVLYNQPGQYSAELIVFGNGGSDTLRLDNLVTAIGLPQTEISTDQTQNQVLFNSSNTDVTTYLWDFGDGNTSDEESPLHIFGENGTFLVLLTVTGDCGSTTVETEVTINAYPVGALSAENSKGCAPLEVEFAQIGENVISVEWMFPGGSPETSSENEVVVTYPEAGIYSVTLISKNELGEDMTVVQNFVEVAPNPTSAFMLDEFEGTITLSNQSENATTYLWDFGDGNNSAEENPTHSYEESGTYTVSLTAYNECGESIDTRELQVEVLGELIFNDFEIYPNPNDGDFTFKIIAQGVGDLNYQIVDPLDRLVSTGTLLVKGSIQEYDVYHPELLQGAYIIRIEFNNEVYVQKMIVSQ